MLVILNVSGVFLIKADASVLPNSDILIFTGCNVYHLHHLCLYIVPIVIKPTWPCVQDEKY